MLELRASDCDFALRVLHMEGHAVTRCRMRAVAKRHGFNPAHLHFSSDVTRGEGM